MRVQRTRTKQLRAPLTTTLGHPKSIQCNFNSCSFNYKSVYSNSLGHHTDFLMCYTNSENKPVRSLGIAIDIFMHDFVVV